MKDDGTVSDDVFEALDCFSLALGYVLLQNGEIKVPNRKTLGNLLAGWAVVMDRQPDGSAILKLKPAGEVKEA